MSKYTYNELKEELKHRSVESVANEITKSNKSAVSLSTLLEQEAVLTALKKGVKTKDDEIRAKIDEEMIKEYQIDGTDRKSLKLGNVKVGTISIRMSKEGYQITDREVFENYLLGSGYAKKTYSLKPFMDSKLKKVLEDNGIEWKDYLDMIIEPSDDLEKDISIVDDYIVNTKTGEVVDGVKPVYEQPVGTVIRGCKPEDVLPIALSMPNQAINNLLMGEVEND